MIDKSPSSGVSKRRESKASEGGVPRLSSSNNFSGRQHSHSLLAEQYSSLNDEDDELHDDYLIIRQPTDMKNINAAKKNDAWRRKFLLKKSKTVAELDKLMVDHTNRRTDGRSVRQTFSNYNNEGGDNKQNNNKINNNNHYLGDKKVFRDKCYSTTTIKESAVGVSKVTVTFKLPSHCKRWDKMKKLLPSMHEFLDLKAMQEHFVQGLQFLSASDGIFIGRLLVNKKLRAEEDIFGRIMGNYRAFQAIREDYPFFEVMMKTIFHLPVEFSKEIVRGKAKISVGKKIETLKKVDGLVMGEHFQAVLKRSANMEVSERSERASEHANGRSERG